MHRPPLKIPLLVPAATAAHGVLAQELGTLNPRPLPPNAIGFYCRSCLAAAQPLPMAGDGCAKTLARWLSERVQHSEPNPHWKPPEPAMTAQLPAECRTVLRAK